jgi:long-chain acyl-CoA synthetase
MDTVPALLHRNATEYADRPALSELGKPGGLTWRQLRDEVAALARGLADLGVGSGDRVLIQMPDRPEHWLADLAAVHLGAVPSTVYATLAPGQLAYLARHSGAEVVVLEGAADLDRWKEALGGVRHVITLDGSSGLSLRQVTERGSAVPEETFEKAWRQVRPDQPVVLLYTSGTTGDPKGVLLTHHNVIYQSVVLEAAVETPPHATSLAYLPLAHIAERVLGVYHPIYRAGHVVTCPDPAQLRTGLTTVRPSSFFGVPRVWEKMAAGVQAQLAAAEPPVQAAVSAAREIALRAHRLREDGEPIPPELASKLAAVDAAVLRPIRARLGLDNVVMASSGAAPIPVEVLHYLAGFGIDVLEVWGMTETTGTATINTLDHFRTGTVGRVNPGMELEMAEDGEIRVRGPLVCAGYLRAGGGVEPVTDEDGWLATGDIGTLDRDGYLTITDRKKELIITAGGKNISPARIESLLRAHPLIAQAVAIGDRRAYVTALIVLDEETLPMWSPTRLPEAAADPAVLAEIAAAVAAANTKLSRPEQVKAFRILPSAWTPETGELTPTLKLRRRVVHDRWADAITELYP